MVKYIVTSNDSNQKIEKYLKKALNNVSLSLIHKIFRKKDVKVNGIRVNKDYIVKENDEIIVYVPDYLDNISVEKKINKLKINFKIVYEDNNILVVDKPVGLLVHEDNNNHFNTLSNQVLSYLMDKNEYDPKINTFTPGPCHRLDRNTSGLVIFGKNINSLKILNEAFKNRNGIAKYYKVLLFHKLDKNMEVKAKLIKDSKSGLVKVSKDGLDSFSIFRPIKYNDNYTYCEVELLTGRTHQIRVHSAFINHPTVGDKKYGDFNLNDLFYKKYKYENQFLHAYKLVFYHLDGILEYLNGVSLISDLDDTKQKIIDDIFN